jgi:predicted dehydrogenase
MPKNSYEQLGSIAVLGTGSIGSRHMNVLRELGVGVIPVALRKTRCKELQKDGWNSSESLQAAAEIGASAVIIATDTGRHLGDIEQALSFGLHVLVEKPMTPSAAVASHLPRYAGQRERNLFVGCCLRFDPGLNYIRDNLSPFGEIHSVRIECGSYLPDWRPGRDHRTGYSARADEGGVLRDLIHEVDYAIWLFGFPEWVFGKLSNFSRIGVASEEMAEGIWRSGSGASVSLSLDYLTRHPRRRISVSGSHGSYDYCLISRHLTIRMVGEETREITFPRQDNDLYFQQASEFLEAISGQSTARLATAEDGLNALIVCDAWRKSSDSGSREYTIIP